MTPEGHTRLRDELKKLKEVELPQVVKDIPWRGGGFGVLAGY